MSRRAAGVVTIVIAAGLLLTGCVVAPPDPTRPPLPSPTRPADSEDVVKPPTAPPAPTAEPVANVDPVVRELVVRPEHLDLVNGAGAVVGTLSYDADAQVFVDTLSGVLGGPPDVAEFPGGHEWSPSTRYTWPGVVVTDDHEAGDYQVDMNVCVRFTHPVVGNGIGVATTQGFRPGDDLRSFASELGEEWHGTGYDEFPAETGPDLGERGYDSWTGTYAKYANANAVSVTLWGAGSEDPTVTSMIFAPWNFGIGHV